MVQQEAIQEKTKNKFRNRRTRNRTLVKELNELYEGRCQLCAFDSFNPYGVSLCAAHHITYVTRGGEDVMSNLLLVCQNCHEAIHKCDAVFDYEKLNYDFGNGRTVPIVINEHLEKRQL